MSDDPKEFLLSLGKRDKVPVYIGGRKFLCRTLMTAGDVYEWDRAPAALSPASQSMNLFIVMGCWENGLPIVNEGDDTEWLMGVSAHHVHKAMKEAKVTELINAQTKADDADEEEGGDEGEGKPETKP